MKMKMSPMARVMDWPLYLVTGILTERDRDDLVELRRDLGPELGGKGQLGATDEVHLPSQGNPRAPEGQAARHHLVESHAQRPDVGREGRPVLGEDLGRHVIERARGRGRELVRPEHPGDPQIGNLRDLPIQEDILGLDVSVEDVLPVDGRQTRRHALGDAHSLVDGHRLGSHPRAQTVSEAPAGHVLHGHDDLVPDSHVLHVLGEGPDGVVEIAEELVVTGELPRVVVEAAESGEEDLRVEPPLDQDGDVPHVPPDLPGRVVGDGARVVHHRLLHLVHHVVGHAEGGGDLRLHAASRRGRQDVLDRLEPMEMVVRVRRVVEKLESAEARDRQRIGRSPVEVERWSAEDGDRPRRRRGVEVGKPGDPAARVDREVGESISHAIGPDVLAEEVAEVPLGVTHLADHSYGALRP